MAPSARSNSRSRSSDEVAAVNPIETVTPFGKFGSAESIRFSRTRSAVAVASANVSSVPWHGSGYRLEIYGREGTLVLTTEQSASIGGVRLLGGKSGSSSLEEIAISPKHTWVPDSVPPGPPFNIAQLWGRFANAIVTGERAEPDFDTAVNRHKMLDAIQRASDTGQRQTL